MDYPNMDVSDKLLMQTLNAPRGTGARAGDGIGTRSAYRPWEDNLPIWKPQPPVIGRGIGSSQNRLGTYIPRWSPFKYLKEESPYVSPTDWDRGKSGFTICAPSFGFSGAVMIDLHSLLFWIAIIVCVVVLGYYFYKMHTNMQKILAAMPKTTP